MQKVPKSKRAKAKKRTTAPAPRTKAPAKRSGAKGAGGVTSPAPETGTSVEPAPSPAPDAPAPGSLPLPEWRRERFCLEYVVDGNGAQAAVRAGYSPGSLHVTASRLLRDATVRERVDYLLLERTQRLRITADRALEETAAIAYSDMGDFLEPEHVGDGDERTPAAQADGAEARLLRGLWRFRSLEDIPPHARRAIQEVSDTISSDGKRKRTIKLHPKWPAVQALLEITRVLVKRMEHSGPEGGPIPTADIPLTEEQAVKRLRQIQDAARSRQQAATGPAHHGNGVTQHGRG